MENRQIKFRAWTHESKMTPTFGIFDWFDDNGRTYIPGFGRVYDPIIMQFTGLLDKNGKEIYEGDICIIQDDDEGFAQNYDEEKDEYIDIEKCVMQWRKDGAGFYPKCDTIDNSEGWYWEQLNFEVIGNIYENPELLTI